MYESADRPPKTTIFRYCGWICIHSSAYCLWVSGPSLWFWSVTGHYSEWHGGLGRRRLDYAATHISWASADWKGVSVLCGNLRRHTWIDQRPSQKVISSRDSGNGSHGQTFGQSCGRIVHGSSFHEHRYALHLLHWFVSCVTSTRICQSTALDIDWLAGGFHGWNTHPHCCWHLIWSRSHDWTWEPLFSWTIRDYDWLPHPVRKPRVDWSVRPYAYDLQTKYCRC